MAILKKKNDFFYAVRIASMNQAAESVAAIPRMIPGALLQPNIATRAKNATMEMMMIEEVIIWFGAGDRTQREGFSD
jgi:hypothetical protein